MERSNRGQSAIEFLMTYGWAILVMLAFVAVLYVFGAFQGSRYVPRTCAIQPGLSCDSFKLMEEPSSGLEVIFSGSNGLGYDIGFSQGQVAVLAENLGALGKQTYTGTCAPSVVRKGKSYTCVVSIPYTERLPGIGEMRTMALQIGYTNLETGQAHTAVGQLTTQAENYAAQDFCGNGVCEDNLGEDASNCPEDCEPRLFTMLIAANPAAIATGEMEDSAVTATLYDQFGNPMNGLTVDFESNSTEGTLSGTQNTTDSEGRATVYLTSGMDPTNVEITATRDTFSASAVVEFAGPHIITGHGYTISEPGSYALIQDSPGGGNGVVIDSDGSGSTLNCNGYTLFGMGVGAGVILDGAHNVTVENCVIRGFSNGIDAADSDNNSIIGNTVNESGNSDMTFASSDNNIFTGNIIGPLNHIGITSGLTLDGSSGNVVSGNAFSSGPANYAVHIRNGDYNNLTGNTLTGGVWCIMLDYTTHNRVEGNLVRQCGYGIGVDHSNSNTLIGNTVTSSVNYGISITASTGNSLTANAACSNPSGDILCDAGQTDGGSNICTPYPGTGCSSSVTCGLGCP